MFLCSFASETCLCAGHLKQLRRHRSGRHQRTDIGTFLCAFHQINFASDQGSDPLVLDLTGFGLNLTPELYNSIQYDFDQNGFLKHTGWTGKGAGFLVSDWNSNGKIDGAGEMFGSASQSGFAALGACNDNHLKWRLAA